MFISAERMLCYIGVRRHKSISMTVMDSGITLEMVRRNRRRQWLI